MPEIGLNQRQLAAEFRQLSADAFNRYADSWAAGQIDLADFERLFKQELKDLYIGTVWSAADTTQATQAQYGLAGRRLRDQYQFAHQFFQDIEAGELTLAEIKARMTLYANSAGQVLEQVGISEADMPALPHYPRDGSTRCKTNDKCTLRKEQIENGWDIYWETHPAEHCPDCVRRRDNSPLRVRFGRVVNPEAWD